MSNPDHQSNQSRERSIPITTTQGNMPTTTHFPLSSASSHPGTSSGPFSSSPGRGGNLFNQLHQFRKNQHADEIFSDRSHFSPFGSMSSGSRNVGDFFSHGHRDEEDCEQESHQPRVYNIPIQVETPEGVVPLARSNSHSPSLSQFRNNNSYHAAPSHGGGPIPERTGETFTRQRPGPSPTPPPKPRFTPSYKPESQGHTHQQYHPDAHPKAHQHHRVHNIPVQVEKTSKPSESVSNQPHFRQDVPNVGRDSPRPESQQSGNGGPHVINIPINNERSQSSENKSQLPPQPAPNHSKANSEPQKGPVDPLDLIKSIKDEACRLESEVNKFDGESQKQYRYLDEMLTRCMLKLDNIDSGGRDEVRSSRKSTLAYVDRVIAILESKVNRPGANQDKEEVPETIESNVEHESCETPSSMEAETGEIDSTQQQESIDENITETNESVESEQTGKVDNNEMEVESGSGQSDETLTDQPDEQQDEDVADGEAIEEEEEEDHSGVDGSSKDFYNCSNNQLSNENICRTTEAVIIEEMDKEEPPEEPPIKVNRANEHDEKINIELNPMLQGQCQGDGVEIINSSEPKIELPPDDSMSSDESLDTLKPSKVSIVMASDNSNSSDDIVDIQPFIEMPDESSVSSKDSDENRESIQIVEESSNNNIQSSPPKPVHA